jgi:hypothetical protein
MREIDPENIKLTYDHHNGATSVTKIETFQGIQK